VVALRATRGHLIRIALTESLVLSLAGAEPRGFLGLAGDSARDQLRAFG
jgi:hypothetical protein